MKQEQRETFDRITNEINNPKSELIRIMDKLYNNGMEKEAEQLGRIIARLEAFQHK